MFSNLESESVDISEHGDQYKEYSINVTESCDDGGLNLIGHVEVKNAVASDVDFLQDGIEKAEEVFTDKVEAALPDGAFHSPDNQKFCEENEIELHLRAMAGKDDTNSK